MLICRIHGKLTVRDLGKLGAHYGTSRLAHLSHFRKGDKSELMRAGTSHFGEHAVSTYAHTGGLGVQFQLAVNLTRSRRFDARVISTAKRWSWVAWGATPGEISPDNFRLASDRPHSRSTAFAVDRRQAGETRGCFEDLGFASQAIKFRAFGTKLRGHQNLRVRVKHLRAGD